MAKKLRDRLVKAALDRPAVDDPWKQIASKVDMPEYDPDSFPTDSPLSYAWDEVFPDKAPASPALDKVSDADEILAKAELHPNSSVLKGDDPEPTGPIDLEDVWPERYKKTDLPKTKGADDLIYEVAEALPKTIERATRGGADQLIDTTGKLLRELLDDAAKVNLIQRQVLAAARKIGKQERKIFERLSDADWDELTKIARSMVNAFGSSKASRRRGAIASLKGKLAELVFYKSDTFTRVFDEAVELVQTLNLKASSGLGDGVRIREGTVAFKQDVRAFSLNKNNKPNSGELTDGIIVAEREDGDYQILAIIEMKSRSNRNDLARRRSGQFEIAEELEDSKIFKREGQLEADIERLDQLDMEFDGEFIPAGTARFSRHNTAWIGVTPSDVSLSDLQVSRIEPLISNFRQHRQEVSDKSLTRLCTQMLRLVKNLSES